MTIRPTMRVATREHALWLTIAVLACVPRLLGLTLPLGDAEASAALSFLSASRGETAMLLNPLAGFLQTLTVTLFGASDAAPRLAPAVAGALLCLAPYLARNTLGRYRALALALLLALSPTLIFVSRNASGEMLAWLLAALLIWRERGASGWLTAVLVGLLLACGAHAIAPALVVLLGAVIDGGVSFLAGLPRKNWIIGGAAFVAGASGLFIRPIGVADAFNGYAAWLQGFGAAPAFSAARLFGGLLLNEVLVLVFAVIALVLIVIDRARMASAPPALSWLAVGLAGVSIYAGREPGLLVPVVIGAAWLASDPLAALCERIGARLREPSGWMDWAVAGVGFVLLQFVGIGLRQYAAQTQSGFLVPIAVAVILCGGLIGAAALNGDAGVGLRGVGLALAAAFGLYAAGAGMQLTQVRWDNPAEPYLNNAPSPELGALVETLRQSGVRATGEPDGVEIGIDASAPAALRWALRDQRKAVVGNTNAEAVLLPSAAKPSGERGYIGNQFEVTRSGDLGPLRCNNTEAALDCSALARWAFFREINPGNVASQRWTLWLSNDLAARISGKR